MRVTCALRMKMIKAEETTEVDNLIIIPLDSLKSVFLFEASMKKTVVAYHGTQSRSIKGIRRDGFRLASEFGGVRAGITSIIVLEYNIIHKSINQVRFFVWHKYS